MTLPRPSRKIAQDDETPAETQPTPSRKFNPNAFRPSDVFVFEPRADITAYEVALLLKVLYDPAIHFKSFVMLPEPLQRYFRPTKA